MFFKTNYHLMQVKSIAECSKGSILQNIRPSLSYHLPLIPLFCLFLSGPEYEQESSNTITHCRPTHGTGRKSHRTQTVTSHVRIQEFFSFFLVLSLFYRGQISYHYSRSQRGSNIFQWGVQPLPGGSNCLFPKETHITCDFPRGWGVRTPCLPSGSALASHQKDN